MTPPVKTRAATGTAGRANTAFRPSSVGHFLVLQSVDAKQQRAVVFNPEQKRRYVFNFRDLDNEWSGAGLLSLRNADFGVRIRNIVREQASAPSTAAHPQLAWLSKAEMAQMVGGCFSVQKQDGLGNGPYVCPVNGNCGGSLRRGAPVVSFNRVTFNQFITNTPLGYTPPVGPSVEITTSYNSDDASNNNTVFGNKWSFNYGSHVIENSGGEVTAYMPDGRQDIYTFNGSGYTSETGVTNTLRKTGTTHYEIEFPGGDKAIYDIPAGTTSQQPFLVALRDRWNNSLTFGYDSEVRLRTITDAQGKVTNLTYNAAGYVTRVDDPFGRHADFSYDANGNLTGVTDMGGNSFGYAYDSSVRVTQLNAPEGTWQFYHEGPDGGSPPSNESYMAPGEPMGLNKRITITDPLSQKEEYYYPAGTHGTWSWHVDKNHYRDYTPESNNAWGVAKTAWTMDLVIGGKGKITWMSRPYMMQSTSEGYNTYSLADFYGYDVNTGLPDSFRRTGNNYGETSKETRFTYNVRGQATSVTNARNYTTHLNYAANGLDVTSVVNALNDTVAASSYNAQHQPLTITPAAGSPTTLTYTAWGALATATNGAGTTTYNYDPTTKRLTSVTRNGVTLSGYTYDTIGRVRTATNAANQTLTYSYNDLDQVTRIDYPDGTHAAYNYLCCGLLTDVTNRAGRTTHYEYDALKRLLWVQEMWGSQRRVQYDYDKNGNLTLLRDPLNQDTLWEYDLADRATKKTYADGSFEEYEHDAWNNLTLRRTTSAQGVPGPGRRYWYDANNNLTDTGDEYGYSRSEYGFDYATITNPADVTLQYDELDRPVRMLDSTGLSNFGYDVLNRLTSADGPWVNDEVTYHYDAAGRRDWMRVSGTNQVSYAYDTLGRLQTLSSPAGTFGYSYVGATGRLSQRQLPNGAVTNYGYDALHRLTQIQNLTGTGATISRYAYGFDVPGTPQRGVRTWTESQVGTNPIQHINFGYDAVNQLTSEVSTEAPLPDVNHSYTYDAMGNRTAAQWPGEQSSYTTNVLNQYTAVSTNGTTANLSYDERGNLLAQGTHRYAYDDANRLSSIVRVDAQTGANEHKSEFVYDGLSRKRITREYDWAEGDWQQIAETRFVYSGRLVIQERDANNNVAATYTRRGNIGGLLARTTADGHFYYHYDGRGNVSQLTDSAQATVARYEYDAFGNTSASGAQAGQPYRFSTKEYHAASGLYDYGFRFYSPGLGRWINRDPISESGGLNLYGFVSNSPVNRVDRFGLTGACLGEDAYENPDCDGQEASSEQGHGDETPGNDPDIGAAGSQGIQVPGRGGSGGTGGGGIGGFVGGIGKFCRSLFGGGNTSSELPGTVGIPIAGPLSTRTMALLQEIHGVEFAQVYNRPSGQYFLYSGTKKTIGFTPNLIPGDYLLSHTHPSSGVRPSLDDINLLALMNLRSGQTCSTIIPAVGKPRRYGLLDDYMDY